MDQATQLAGAHQLLHGTLGMIKAVIDAALEHEDLQIPGLASDLDELEEMLDQHDVAVMEEVRQIRLLLLVVGDVMGKYLAEPAVA